MRGLGERSQAEKGYLLDDPNSVTFWKRQNLDTIKRSAVSPDVREEG